jgi:hypothetical protein
MPTLLGVVGHIATLPWVVICQIRGECHFIPPWSDIHMYRYTDTFRGCQIYKNPFGGFLFPDIHTDIHTDTRAGNFWIWVYLGSLTTLRFHIFFRFSFPPPNLVGGGLIGITNEFQDSLLYAQINSLTVHI